MKQFPTKEPSAMITEGSFSSAYIRSCQCSSCYLYGYSSKRFSKYLTADTFAYISPST